MVEQSAPQEKPTQAPNTSGAVRRVMTPKSELPPTGNIHAPTAKEVDTLSFLQVEKEKATTEFNEKNTLHRKLLAQIDQLKIKANEARDEVLRVHGTMQHLDEMIERVKGTL